MRGSIKKVLLNLQGACMHYKHFVQEVALLIFSINKLKQQQLCPQHVLSFCRHLSETPMPNLGLLHWLSPKISEEFIFSYFET